MTVADTALVPGECARAEAEARGGLVRVETRDPRGHIEGRWVRAPAGKVTVLTIDAEGQPAVVDRRACDGTPVPLR